MAELLKKDTPELKLKSGEPEKKSAYVFIERNTTGNYLTREQREELMTEHGKKAFEIREYKLSQQAGKIELYYRKKGNWEQADKYNKIMFDYWEAFNIKNIEIGDSLNKKYIAKYNPERKPIYKEEFMKEMEYAMPRFKKEYKDVHTFSEYGDVQGSREFLKGIGPEDDIFILGHAGDRLSGIEVKPTETNKGDWGDIIKQSVPKDFKGKINMGSCGMVGRSYPCTTRLVRRVTSEEGEVTEDDEREWLESAKATQSLTDYTGIPVVGTKEKWEGFSRKPQGTFEDFMFPKGKAETELGMTKERSMQVIRDEYPEMYRDIVSEETKKEKLKLKKPKPLPFQMNLPEEELKYTKRIASL